MKDALSDLIDSDLTMEESFANVRCLFDTCGAEKLSPHIMEMLHLMMRSNSREILLFILSFEAVQLHLVSVVEAEKVESLRKVASIFTFCFQDEALFLTLFNRFPLASKRSRFLSVAL